MNIGFALTGSFCTFSQVYPIMQKLCSEHTVIPIMSQNSCRIDSRFGSAQEHILKAQSLTGHVPLQTLEDVEPIGPKKLLDLLIIAPCTGNTLAKLASGIADTPVTMAAKSHLRNGRPIVVALSTNDALAGAAPNIGLLLNRRYYYFVPFRQDDPFHKPTSMVADFSKIPQTAVLAMEGKQLQPLII